MESLACYGVAVQVNNVEKGNFLDKRLNTAGDNAGFLN